MKLIEDLRSRLMDAVSPWQIRARAVMVNEVQPRYQQLVPREQRLLLAAAVLLPLMVLWFGIVLPLHDRQQALQADLVVLQQQAGEAQYLATQAGKQGNGDKAAQPVNLLASVEQLARQLQLREFMTRIRPQPAAEGVQRLMLELKDAPYERVIRFSHALANENLELYSMKIQIGAAGGLVHVQAVIEGK